MRRRVISTNVEDQASIAYDRAEPQARVGLPFIHEM
jgi:hypothetical protein